MQEHRGPSKPRKGQPLFQEEIVVPSYHWIRRPGLSEVLHELLGFSGIRGSLGLSFPEERNHPSPGCDSFSVFPESRSLLPHPRPPQVFLSNTEWRQSCGPCSPEVPEYFSLAGIGLLFKQDRLTWKNDLYLFKVLNFLKITSANVFHFIL